MDTAKLRLFAAVSGALFGFAGIVALAVALVLALAPIIGAAWAAVTAAMIFMTIACVCLYAFLQPHKASTEEIDQIENVTADALADLPFDTLQAMLEKHPLKVTTIALIAGYGIVNNPDGATKQVQRMMMGLL